MSQERSLPADTAFFERDTLVVARDLLGAVLTTKIGGILTSGRIVEVEAYTRDDPASHCFRGMTPRNAPMFSAPGTMYVYRSYGIHLCFNLVTEAAGQGSAVLIRAIEPIDGLEVMRKRRQVLNDWQLANGPGKLTRALAIDMQFNGRSVLESDDISIAPVSAPNLSAIAASTRIGISRAIEKEWRFYYPHSRFISRHPGPYQGKGLPK